METQFVRLDAPYNLICGKGLKFGLHIATLIIVTETEDDNPIVRSYPVVDGDNLGGEPWMNCELNDCKVICRQGEKVTLRDIRNIMEYYSKQGEILLSLVPLSLRLFLVRNKIELISERDKSGNVKENYEVELVFEENEAVPNACLVRSGTNSLFFFETAFIGIPDRSDTKQNFIYKTAIESLKRMRNAYCAAFIAEGVKTITFFTKKGKYQKFVDFLNKG